MKTSLLNWIKTDIDNQFKFDASYWEIDPLIKNLNLANETVDVSINLYVNEDAFLNGGKSIKTRSYRVDLSGWDGIKPAFISAIKSGVENMVDIEIGDGIEDQIEVAGFFNI